MNYSAVNDTKGNNHSTQDPMITQTVKRPWNNHSSYGNKTNHNPFYNTTAWRKSRAARRLGHTIVNGHKLLNIYCVECFKETGKELHGSNDDHIVAIEDGGDKFDYNNRQTLCDSHHAKKSAKEGNERRKK